MSMARTDETPDADTRRQRPEGMGGLVKGLAIIESFTVDRTRLTISEAAKATGITPAAARRCLLTLESLGYLTFDGKFFRATPRMTRLGAAYAEVSTLSALAQPCIDAVRDQLAETCSIAVLDGDSSLFIARAEAVHLVTAGVRVGTRLPLHASASGRILLSGMDEAEVEERLRDICLTIRTPKSLRTVAEVHEAVRRGRSEGVIFADEELEIGLRAMAVPVKDSGGQLRAAMTVSALTGRASMEDMRTRFLGVLREQADRLGRML